MKVIDGKSIAQEIVSELREKVSLLPIEQRPRVHFIRIGDDPASVSYVNKKSKWANEIGIESDIIILPMETTQDELFAVIDEYNAREDVHGILIQAPLPSHISEIAAFNRVRPEKDVDGFHTINTGKLCQEDASGFVACTPAGIVELLERSNIDTEGKQVVVLGRSLIVGKPAGLLLLRRATGGNATVTFCHSRSKNLPEITSRADILIAAIGKANFVTADMIKAGAVIIDVGINRISDSSRKSGFRLVGDVDYDKVSPICSQITPVPGGVGPMTVAMLMKNTVKAFEQLKQRG